jgi:hypothetical protein
MCLPGRSFPYLTPFPENFMTPLSPAWTLVPAQSGYPFPSASPPASLIFGGVTQPVDHPRHERCGKNRQTFCIRVYLTFLNCISPINSLHYSWIAGFNLERLI